MKIKIIKSMMIWSYQKLAHVLAIKPVDGRESVIIPTEFLFLEQKKCFTNFRFYF